MGYFGLQIKVSPTSGGTVSTSIVPDLDDYYTWTITVSGNTLKIIENGSYTYKTITASANPGYKFSSWTGYQSTITSSHTITANFKSATTKYWYVTKYHNNGTGDYESPIKIPTTSSYTVVDPDPSWATTGYESLKCWNTKSDGTGTRYKKGESGHSIILKQTEGTNIKIYAQWTPIKYTITYNTDGGSTITPTKEYFGNSFSLPSAKKSNGIYSYNVKVYKDKTKAKLISDKDVKGTETFEFNEWYSNSKGTKFGGGDSYEVIGKDTLTALYNETKVEKALGSALPSKDSGSMKTIGYTPGIWTTDGVNEVDKNSEFNSDVVIYCTWDPVEYKYTYTLNDGATWEDEAPSELEINKTFGSEEGASLTTKKAYKFGYTFKGWKWVSDTKTITYAYGGKIDDEPYKELNGKSNNIRIYPWFEPTPNKIIFRYYCSESGDNYFELPKEYTIETGEFIQYGPDNKEMGEDYVFSGWSYGEKDSEGKPVIPGWFTSATKGIFSNDDKLPDDADKNNPLTILSKNILVWGAPTEYYYATWTKTGKYVKIGDSWKKVSVVYTKCEDGSWKPVNNLQVKTDSGWKEEI